MIKTEFKLHLIAYFDKVDIYEIELKVEGSLKGSSSISFGNVWLRKRPLSSLIPQSLKQKRHESTKLPKILVLDLDRISWCDSTF